jgi:hypothetical protein
MRCNDYRFSFGHAPGGPAPGGKSYEGGASDGIELGIGPSFGGGAGVELKLLIMSFVLPPNALHGGAAFAPAERGPRGPVGDVGLRRDSAAP